MIARIIRWSIANRFLVLLAVLFIAVWGVWAVKNTPIDALPDLSDVQVIIFTEWMGRSPDLIEDQITYPISSSLATSRRCVKSWLVAICVIFASICAIGCITCL